MLSSEGLPSSLLGSTEAPSLGFSSLSQSSHLGPRFPPHYPLGNQVAFCRNHACATLRLTLDIGGGTTSSTLVPSRGRRRRIWSVHRRPNEGRPPWAAAGRQNDNTLRLPAGERGSGRRDRLRAAHSPWRRSVRKYWRTSSSTVHSTWHSDLQCLGFDRARRVFPSERGLRPHPPPAAS